MTMDEALAYNFSTLYDLMSAYEVLAEAVRVQAGKTCDHCRHQKRPLHCPDVLVCNLTYQEDRLAGNAFVTPCAVLGNACAAWKAKEPDDDH